MVGPKGPIDIDVILEQARNYLPESDLAIVKRAYEFAEAAHAHQMRISGEPYIQHCLAVAQMLAELHLDHETLAAALLHDVLEDTDISYDTLEKEFGPQVAKLVDGVTKLSQIDRWTEMERRREDEGSGEPPQDVPGDGR